MISIFSWIRSNIHLRNKFNIKQQLPLSCFAFYHGPKHGNKASFFTQNSRKQPYLKIAKLKCMSSSVLNNFLYILCANGLCLCWSPTTCSLWKNYFHNKIFLELEWCLLLTLYMYLQLNKGKFISDLGLFLAQYFGKLHLDVLNEFL